MPLKSKSEKDFENADDIVATDERLLVLDAVLSGKSIAQLSRETHIPETLLRKRKQEVAATLTQHYHDELEYVRARSMARLEKIYAIAEPWAFGLRRKAHADGSETFESSGIPDRQWIKLLLEIIDRENAMKQLDERFAAEKREQGTNLNYTNIQHLTLVSGQELYEVARHGMWGEYQGKSPDQLEQLLLETVVARETAEPDISDLKQRLDRISNELGVDSDNEGDADDAAP